MSSEAASSDKQWQTFVADYNKHLTRKLRSKGIPGGSLAIVNIGQDDFIRGIGRTKIENGRACAGNRCENFSRLVFGIWN